MPRVSAGLLMYRIRGGRVEALLVHPGGPLWAKKDLEAWSIPKGELDGEADPLSAAKREFEEETGMPAAGVFTPLASLRQPSGKLVHVWAFEGDCNASASRSNTFEMEWPPRSGRRATFPEVDRAEWFDLAEARRRILPGQLGFLDQLERLMRPND